MSDEIEIGQALFGNPTGKYGTPEYADALIESILSEIERIFWNTNQRQWDRYEDPKMKGVEFRPYWWGDESALEAGLPNLKLENNSQEIRWYKYPHRGQSCTVNMDEKEWVNWFNKAMELIRSNEKDLF